MAVLWLFLQPPLTRVGECGNRSDHGGLGGDDSGRWKPKGVELAEHQTCGDSDEENWKRRVDGDDTGEDAPALSPSYAEFRGRSWRPATEVSDRAGG